MQISYRTVDVDGVDIFYRELGSANAPVLLLLHGFPSAGHMFRDLMPLLADRFRVVAPDLPGFGMSAMPPRESFAYTFAHLAEVIGRFTEILGLEEFAMYVFDYGAPVGFRMALEHPERIRAIVSQNGNAYEDGLSDGWAGVRAYWNDPSAERRSAIGVDAFSHEALRGHYFDGVSDPSRVSPDGLALDEFYFARPNMYEIQLDLLLDYRTNVDMYPAFQRYLREHQPPVLAIWGRNDGFFLPAGAEAFKRDVPAADVHFLDTGHFALETNAADIATAIRAFLR